jgi:hypothetical protein
MKRAAIILAAATLLTSGARMAWATDGAATTVVGTKGPVSIPVDGDAQTVFRMPSSIAWGDQSRIDLDAFLFVPVVTVRNITNDYHADSVGPGGSGGVVISLPWPGDDTGDPDSPAPAVKYGRLQLHVGEYVEMGGAGGASKLASLAYPEGKATETNVSMLGTVFTVAYAPVEWFGFGASFHFIYGQLQAESLIGGGSASLNGSPRINGVSLPGNPTYTDFINLFSTGSVGDPATYVTTSNMISLQATGCLGISLRPLPELGFGLSFQPESLVLKPFTGSATVDATRTVALAVGPLAQPLQNLFLSTLPNGGREGYVSKYSITVKGVRTPDTARANVVWWPFERLLVSAEVGWYGWFRSLMPTAVLKGGTNQDLTYMIGGDEVVTKITVRWANEFVYSLYASYGITDDISVRLGFNYGGMPVNADTMGNGPNSAIVSTTFTVGAGYRIFDGLEINALFETSLYDSIHSDGAPTSASARYADYSARQFLFHLGFGYAF